MNNDLVCHSQQEFNEICSKLERFTVNTSGPHQRIKLDNLGKPIDTQPKACWLSRVVMWLRYAFSCGWRRQSRGTYVAEKVVLFFEANRAFLKPRHSLALACLNKIKYKTSFYFIGDRYAALKDAVEDQKRYTEQAIIQGKEKIDAHKNFVDTLCQQMHEEGEKVTRAANALFAEAQATKRNAEAWCQQAFSDTRQQAQKIMEAAVAQNQVNYENSQAIAKAQVDKIINNAKADAAIVEKQGSDRLVALVQNIGVAEQRLKDATTAADRAEAEVAAKRKQDLAKATEDAAAIVETARKNVGALEKAAMDGIDTLNATIKNLEARRATLYSKIHAVEDCPATLVCEGGEIPNVPYRTLEGLPFLSGVLTWDMRAETVDKHAQATISLASNQKEKDSKSSVEPVKAADVPKTAPAATAAPAALSLDHDLPGAVSLEMDKAEELVKTKIMKIDLRPHRVEVVQKLLVVALMKDLTHLGPQKPEFIAELFALGHFLALPHDHAMHTHCKWIFKNPEFLKDDANCLFLLRSVIQGSVHVELQEHFFNIIRDNLKLFSKFPETASLSHERFVTLLTKSSQLSDNRLRALVRNWVSKASNGEVSKHMELLTRKTGENSIWSICFSKVSTTKSGEIMQEMTDAVAFASAQAAFAEYDKKKAEDSEKAKSPKQKESGWSTFDWRDMSRIISSTTKQLSFSTALKFNNKEYKILMVSPEKMHPNRLEIFIENLTDSAEDFKVDFRIENVQYTYGSLKAENFLLTAKRSAAFGPCVGAWFDIKQEIRPYVRNDTLRISINIRN